MITASELRAARAPLGLDPQRLAELSGLSLPTIQRMEAGDRFIRDDLESLAKLMGALNAAGLDVIEAGAVSAGGGRGLRLRRLPLADDGRRQRPAPADSPRLGPHTD